ncbi:SMI1/KNR4 family protein [Tenacibaculum finnmarkense]|uniref:SMI1/KNR4 family protein n=1 Tax=Tenacibaculum finnmarkense TaxID=2781243 RepID=UPI0022FFC745|nr:SMI1/KNR4 family protein [Tenacibaculum finnmarkense]WCC46283.1 hypothetical protein PJH08_07720 [Tenacibaculum finnmarkense]
MIGKPKFGNCLEFRNEIIDLEKIENKFGIKTPPIYRSFINNFKQITGEIVIDSTNNELKTLSYYVYKKSDGTDTLFEDFMPIEQSLENYDNSDSWIENKVIPIGNHSHGGGILIGIDSSNMDKIYYEYDSGVELIEPDIFSFIKNMTFVENEEGIKNSIYKNWKDEYWREPK